jgi:hypothetical protein
MAAFCDMGFEPFQHETVMKRRHEVAFFLCVLSAMTACARAPMQISSACERSLVGTWKSDGEQSMSFNRARSKLSAAEDAFLVTLMGKMTKEYDGDTVRLRMPSVDMRVGDAMRRSDSFEEIATYDVLSCDSRKIVIQTKDDKTGVVHVGTYHVVDKDLMWVYGGSNDPEVPDLHIREYFRRVP